MAPFFGPSGAFPSPQAPGRLDLFAGITDYSGSLVLQLPLPQSTSVGVAWQDDRFIHACSQTLGDFFLPLDSRHSRNRCGH
ncbi:MAG: hypothetical protein AB1486_35390 [Planctomycetota bacterium]